MPGKFVIKKGSTGKFRFNLVSTNGQVVATSEAYETKASAQAGIRSVKKLAADAADRGHHHRRVGRGRRRPQGCGEGEEGQEGRRRQEGRGQGQVRGQGRRTRRRLTPPLPAQPVTPTAPRALVVTGSPTTLQPVTVTALRGR